MSILSISQYKIPYIPAKQKNNETYQQCISFQEWVWTLTGQNRQNREKVDPGGELQIMLPAQPDKPTSGEVCLLAESPFRILRVSAILNLKYFEADFEIW